MKVGFVGLGRMGRPMAANIARAGIALVVWNRTPDRCDPLVEVGAEVAADPASLGGAVDVLVTMLSDGPAVRSVLVDGELLDALPAGAVVLEMSTTGREWALELAAQAGRRGVHLLDAPVSGSVTVAESAALLAMVGGERAAYERVTPVLDSMTKAHIHLGPSGSGATMKIALNTMIAATNQAIAEAIALAERSGIDRTLAYEVLGRSALASPFLLYKRGAFLEPETEPVAFPLELMAKDMALASALARAAGVATPVADAATGVLERASGAGLARADIARVIDMLAGGEPQPKEDEG